MDKQKVSQGSNSSNGRRRKNKNNKTKSAQSRSENKFQKDTQTALSKETQYSFPKGTMKGNSFVVSKREFVKNIIPQDPFGPIKIEFNPGLPGSFPWLSGLAPNFEKYFVRKLRVEYETAQSTFAPGMVMFAPEFNVSDPLPTTKTELLEYAFAARAPVWKNFSMDLPSSSIMNFKDYYVRTGPVNTDLKLYDPLYITVATDAVSTDLAYCGELWFSYEIEFKLPQIINSSISLLNNYKQLTLGTGENGGFHTDAIYQTVTSNQGNLLITLTDSQTLRFDQDFNGFIWYVINATNVEDQQEIYANPPLFNFVGTGSCTMAAVVGGDGFSYVLFVCKNVSSSSFLQITRLYPAVSDVSAKQAAMTMVLSSTLGY
jgi:hypothetical protein